MGNDTYDAIIVGLGAMGSAAAYQVARRGQRMLGLDAYSRGHTHGSSHGKTRIIREAYYEAPEYVPLIRRSYELWHELESESGRDLLTTTGILNFGAPDGELVSGALRSAREHRIDHDYLDAHQVRDRFPMVYVPDGLAAVYERNAGLLYPEACIEAHLDLAAGHGAEIRHEEPVRRWEPDGNGIRVETDQETYRADRLIVAGGPWSGQLLANLGLPLEVWRILHVHFDPPDEATFAPPACPILLWEIPEGVYSSFPALPGHGVKFGRHDIGEVCTPQTVRREVTTDEIDELRSMLNAYLPGAGGAVKETITCLYTMTPDHHFIIDQHPVDERIVFACGFSGHGYKFATVIGEILADLALDGRTRHPVGFLSASRFPISSSATGSGSTSVVDVP